MTRHVPDAGSYAPVTILIEELPGGGTRLAYDSVVSELAIYDDPAATQVAEKLDAEVLGLLRQVSGLSPTRRPGAASWLVAQRVAGSILSGAQRSHAICGLSNASCWEPAWEPKADPGLMTHAVSERRGHGEDTVYRTHRGTGVSGAGCQR